MADRTGPDHDIPRNLADLYVTVWADLMDRLGREPTGPEVDAELARCRDAGVL